MNLVQSLLLQELKQSTLDEIFTLLEPYLKLPEKLAREMAITILHATLKTFLENRFPLENHLLNESSSSSDSTTISTTLAFSPGPYIMGSLVPRCFDGSKLVQSNSLACLQLLVSSLYMYIYYWVLQMSKKFSEMKSHLKWIYVFWCATAITLSTRANWYLHRRLWRGGTVKNIVHSSEIWPLIMIKCSLYFSSPKFIIESIDAPRIFEELL